MTRYWRSEMRGLLSLVALTLAFTSLAPAQQPRVVDLHEILTKQLQQTLASQKKVLDDIRALLEESLRNQKSIDADRARLEMQADVLGLKAQISQQSADITLLKAAVATAKTQVEKLEVRNHILESETEMLRSEIASQGLQRQHLQAEVKQLRITIEADKKKKEKRDQADPKPGDGGKKKDG